MTAREVTVNAQRDALSGLLDWLTEACIDLGIDDGQRARLAIVLEELFLNTVDHGYAGKPGQSIRYRLVTNGGEGLLLCQEDLAPAFDLSRAATPTASMDRVGGLGITMIHGMSKNIQYRQDGDLNVTTIQL